MNRKAKWALSLMAVPVLTLLGMIFAVDTSPPPPMHSVIDVARSVDRSDMPAVTNFTARDGISLAYRLYPGENERVIAILVHGSSDSSAGMHAVGKALSENGIKTYAVDIRGHGNSGSKGDIQYIGQLEDDMADLVGHIRKSYPTTPLALFGHSSGGGFVLRMAGSSSNKLFSKYLVTAPYLRHDAPTSRGAEGGGWARPFVSRIIAVGLLHHVGIHTFDGLPVLSFAVPESAPLTKAYSYRLFDNFGPSLDYLQDVKRSNAPILILVGADDEVFLANKYEMAFAQVKDKVNIEVIPKVGHMGIVGEPAALRKIVDAIQRT